MFLDICSGSSRPLSTSMLHLGASVVSFDILLDPRMDILNDSSYEKLLRLCASRQVAYGCASPSCSQYSRLKLRPPEDLQKVQESAIMLQRCVQCLLLVYLAGGHVHLEQPTNAMSWLEAGVRSFLKHIRAQCINLAACAFGENWAKSWLFATSFPGLQTLACACPHPVGMHQPIAGHRDAAGNFLSRVTAQYPQQLADRFAWLVCPLVAGGARDLNLDDALRTVPQKSILDPPFSQEDGGGFTSGLNARCRVPERVTLPSAKDVLRCYPIRQESRELAGFSIDIKSAHKRIVVRPSEQGLVGFTLDGVVYFYKVAPFGACFSAAWWARLGGWILRFWHLLIWIAHTGHLFVDDFLFMQRADIIPITAAMVALSCQVLGIPVSWAKTELSGTIEWIGWVFHISTGFLEIPEDKVRKIHLQISDLLRSNKTTVKSLQKFIGLAMWITQLFPFMRIWLHHLYRSLNTIPATHYSVEPDNWGGIVACLSDKLVFVRQPQGTAVPVGATLLSVSHQAVGCLTDLSRVRIPHKRIWLRIVNPHSTKRRLDSDACRTLHLFQDWLGKLPPVQVLRPKPRWHGDALADACAHGSECQIGGFLRIDSSVVFRKVHLS